MPGHNKTLIFQLLRDIARGRTRDLDPGLAKDGTGYDDEGGVDDCVDWIKEGLGEIMGRGHVVCDSGAGIELGRALFGFPLADELDEEVVREAIPEHLRDHEDVGGESRLQHDGHIGGVEETDWVAAAHAALAGGFDGDFDTEALEVDHCGEDSDCAEEVHDVGEVGSVERFLQGSCLVWPCDEEVEEGDDCAFKFFAAASVDSGWGEGAPNDGLADAGCDEEGDAAAEAVAFLQELIEENDHKTSHYELDNEEEADASTEVGGLAIETCQDKDAGLAEGENDREELLGGLVEFAV